VYLKKALAVQMSTSGFQHQQGTDKLKNLASCLTSLGKRKEAKDYLDRALECLNDENHPQFAPSLYEIGICNITLPDQSQRAITCLESALMTERSLHGEEHSELALTLYYLSVILE
jgi:tetratricopeptide (TPR) repeat protein